MRIFGIDLGTTYSAIAYVDETGRPTVCRNIESLETTPSVVFFENELNVVVGAAAKNSAIMYPDQVIERIKREMGRQATFEFDGKTYTPESISALILKQLVQDAEAHTDGEVTSAVITVPAYFGMLERDATKKAGEIAGLDVIGIVPEPVAAALHYEATTGADGRTILVYDLGGGTFDTTVIRVDRDEITVVCTDGNDHLGGADWDARLRDYLLDQFGEQVPPDTSYEDDEQFMQSLAATAEETKKQLSQTESRPVALRAGGASARVTVSREQFEGLTADLLDMTVEIVKRTLATFEEKEPGGTIDEVLLVGGATKMPMVARRLRAEFGWEPKLHDPDLAVAKGAALYALGRFMHTELESLIEVGDADKVVKEFAGKTGMDVGTLRQLAAKKTHTVLPKAFGVRLVDTSDPDWQKKPIKHVVEHLVHANDRLPTGDRELRISTLWEGQTAIDIDLYEQAGPVAGPDPAENKPVNEGSGTISGLPPLPARSPVHVRMSVDEEGLLRLNAVEPSTGTSLDIQVRVSVLTDEEVERAKEAIRGVTVSS